jgi:mRNA interferase HigB
LKEFWAEHPDSERPLKAWLRLMKLKRYQSPHDVRADFGTADFLTDKVAVFDIGGNKYRLVVTMRYDWGTVFIRHVLTQGIRPVDGSRSPLGTVEYPPRPVRGQMGQGLSR